MTNDYAMAVAVTSPFLNASDWLRDALLGTFSTSLAIIAVGFVGLRMVTGHMSPVLVIRVLAGCFVLFGAPTIASGLIAAAKDGYHTHAPDPLESPKPPSLPRPDQVDPYAGASAQHM